MAEIPVLEAAPGETPAKPPSKSKWLIIVLSLLLVLGGGGAGAWFYFAGQETASAAQAGAPGKGKAKEELPKGPALFVELDPPFVTNFEAQQLVRFLQITAYVMSRDPETIELVKANDPIVRNDLLMLFNNQKYENIATREGKERLRQEALQAVRNVVKQAGGKPNNVEAVYFTSFVMQ